MKPQKMVFPPEKANSRAFWGSDNHCSIKNSQKMTDREESLKREP